jgi:FixJ family two-component response regulator
MSERPDADIRLTGTVFVIDDDAAICESLCNLLESMGMNVESFSSAEDFFAKWRQDTPGCLLLDVRLPGMTGVEFQEKLIQCGSSIPIIFMTAHGDVPMVRKVMKAGAIEFLTKPFQKEELLAAIRSALEIDSSRRRADDLGSSISARFALLVPREREVLDLVTAGLLNKQIAATLNLSEITVKLHRRHVMEKMQANSLADLVRMADAIKEMKRRSPSSFF